MPALRRPRGPLAGLGALLAAVTVLAGCGSGHHLAASPVVVNRPPLESIFEAGPQLLANPAGTLDELRRLGVDRVKVFVSWSAVAPDPKSPTPPAGFQASDLAAYPTASWAPYDAIIKDATARGIGVDLTLSNPPAWAAGPGEPRNSPPGVWKPSPSEFGAFVRAVGTRYNGTYKPPGASSPLPRVSFWAIWNEPNYGQDLAPQAIDHTQVEVSPYLYRGLLDAAWTALHQTGHGSDTILIGETAPRGQTTGNHPGNFDGMVPLRWLRALYCVDSNFHELQGTAAALRHCPTSTAASASFRADNPALFDATGYADHPYPQFGTPPDMRSSDEPDYADLASLPELEQTLDSLQLVYGSSIRFPIYSTEFGYQTDPPSTIPGLIGPTTAAAYLNQSEYISWRDPQVVSYDQYQLVDAATFPSALRFSNGTRKATYAAYRLPIYLPVMTLTKGQRAEVWGCVRPARFARIDTRIEQRVRIQFKPASGGTFATVRTVPLTDPYGYFDVSQSFASTGFVRLAWSYPRGPTILSREVFITVR